MANCSWTLLWLVWIALVGVLLFCLRGPLKIVESIENASSYFNNLTPKFYVALTGTSSLVSGIILIFEWWYFKNNAIETSSEDGSDNEDSVESTKSMPECKVWRNPMALLRGAEYARFKERMQLEPLTYYDMNLSAQDHQTCFTCDEDVGKPDYEIMQVAWRERDSSQRCGAAHAALDINPDCAPALILLAEEECETVTEAEAMLKKALRATETALAAYTGGNGQLSSSAYGERIGDIFARSSRRRDINMQMYIKRRLAMCARKQGRLREAIKMFKDMSRDGSMGAILNVQENLIEACLEMQAYGDVQALLVRYDGYGAPCSYELREPRSAVLSYTSALLKVRAVAENFRCSIDYSIRRGLSSAEQTAIEALTRAMEFNPHVPSYLLEMRQMIMPPEHYLKRGDSEALAYAFFNIQHWKRIDGSLQLLNIVWRDFSTRISVNNYCYPYSPQLETADRELIPNWYDISIFPKKESTLWSLFQTVGCMVVCAGALMIHHYPSSSSHFANILIMSFFAIGDYFRDMFNQWAPTNIISLLASKQVPVTDL